MCDIKMVRTEANVDCLLEECSMLEIKVRISTAHVAPTLRQRRQVCYDELRKVDM
jgi:hypothetical protein